MLAMTLASVKRTEAFIAQMEMYLGVNAPELQRDDLAVLKLVDELASPIDRDRVLDPEYLRHWSSTLFRVDQAYLKSVGRIVHSPEPWRPFCDFVNRVTYALYYEERAEAPESSEELDFAQRCFQGACRHLSAIAYHVATGASEKKTAVEDVFELLRKRDAPVTPPGLDRRPAHKKSSEPNTPVSRGGRQGIAPIESDAEALGVPRPLRKRRGEGGGGNVMH
jgi:hypothetical protein